MSDEEGESGEEEGFSVAFSDVNIFGTEGEQSAVPSGVPTGSGPEFSDYGEESEEWHDALKEDYEGEGMAEGEDEQKRGSTPDIGGIDDYDDDMRKKRGPEPPKIEPESAPELSIPPPPTLPAKILETMDDQKKVEEAKKDARPVDYDSTIQIDLPPGYLPKTFTRIELPDVPQYQLYPNRPFSYERIKSLLCKAVPRFFADHIYSPMRSCDRIRMLSSYLLRKVYNLGCDRRKIIVVTRIQEKAFQSSRAVVRILWSEETDGMAQYVYDTPKFIVSSFVILLYMD